MVNEPPHIPSKRVAEDTFGAVLAAFLRSNALRHFAGPMGDWPVALSFVAIQVGGEAAVQYLD